MQLISNRLSIYSGMTAASFLLAADNEHEGKPVNSSFVAAASAAKAAASAATVNVSRARGSTASSIQSQEPIDATAPASSNATTAQVDNRYVCSFFVVVVVFSLLLLDNYLQRKFLRENFFEKTTPS
jgi:hypothetical protein